MKIKNEKLSNMVQFCMGVHGFCDTLYDTNLCEITIHNTTEEIERRNTPVYTVLCVFTLFLI